MEDRHLQLQLGCSEDSGVLAITSQPISDGHWHHVTLELSLNSSSLSLDDWTQQAPPIFRLPGPDWSISIGARHSDGFQGCLDSLALNDDELPLHNKQAPAAKHTRPHAHTHVEVTALGEVTLGCVLHHDPCARQPCAHGAACTGLPNGGVCKVFSLRCLVEGVQFNVFSLRCLI